MSTGPTEHHDIQSKAKQALRLAFFLSRKVVITAATSGLINPQKASSYYE